MGRRFGRADPSPRGLSGARQCCTHLLFASIDFHTGNLSPTLCAVSTLAMLLIICTKYMGKIIGIYRHPTLNAFANTCVWGMGTLNANVTELLSGVNASNVFMALISFRPLSTHAKTVPKTRVVRPTGRLKGSIVFDPRRITRNNIGKRA